MKWLIIAMLAAFAIPSIGAAESLCDFNMQPYMNFSVAMDNSSIISDGGLSMNFSQGQGIYAASYLTMYNQTTPMNFSFLFKIPCPANTTYNFSVLSQNYTLPSGRTGYIFITVKSSDLSILSLNFSSSNSTILKPEQNAILYPGQEASVPVLYNTTGLIGNFTVNLTALSRAFPINIEIRDTSPPVIKDIIFNETSKAGEDIPVTVIAEDDVNVSAVQAYMEENTTVNFTRNQDRWVANLTTEQLGTQQVVFTAYDSQGNNDTKSERLVVSSLGGITYYKYNPLQIAYGFSYRDKIFSSEYPIKISVEMTDLDLSNNQSSYEFTLDGGSIQTTSFKLGRRENFDNFIGDLYLTSLFSNVTDYNGKIQITVPEYVGDSESVELKGQVGSITIIPEKTIPFLDTNLYCRFNNTGFLESSLYACTYYVKASDIAYRNPGILLTEEQLQNIKARVNASETLLSAQLAGEQVKSGIELFIIILMASAAIIIYFLKFSGRMVRVSLKNTMGGGDENDRK